MRSILRYGAALLAVLMLTAAAALGLAGAATTSAFMRAVYGSSELLMQQQERMIGQRAEELARQWHIAPETLAPYLAGAAEKQAQAMAAWWGELWSDPEAEPYMPAYLDAAAEREMVNAIMQDEGFRAATDENQRRAIARDEVAYALDEAVCEAVTPLRRSIVELGVSLIMERASLPLLRQGMLLGAAVLAGMGAVLLLAARRIAGSALMVLAGTMALCAAWVWTLDIPGMLVQLSPMAAQQGSRALALLAALWLLAGALSAGVGMIVIRVKKAVERRR